MIDNIYAAAAIPFKIWKTAADDGKFLFKSIDLALSSQELADLFFPGNSVVGCVGAFASWAKPSVAMAKAYTDGVEPSTDVLEKSGELYRSGSYLKLAAKVALVAGILLALPVYLNSIGAISLGALTMNVSRTACTLKAIDLTRFSLIAFGSTYKLCETISKMYTSVLKMKKECAPDESLVAKVWNSMELKPGLDFSDTATKVALFGVTLISGFCVPIDKCTGVIVLNAVNKTAGCWKEYIDATSRAA